MILYRWSVTFDDSVDVDVVPLWNDPIRRGSIPSEIVTFHPERSDIIERAVIIAITKSLVLKHLDFNTT